MEYVYKPKWHGSVYNDFYTFVRFFLRETALQYMSVTHQLCNDWLALLVMDAAQKSPIDIEDILSRVTDLSDYTEAENYGDQKLEDDQLYAIADEASIELIRILKMRQYKCDSVLPKEIKLIIDDDNGELRFYNNCNEHTYKNSYKEDKNILAKYNFEDSSFTVYDKLLNFNSPVNIYHIDIIEDEEEENDPIYNWIKKYCLSSVSNKKAIDAINAMKLLTTF